MSTIIERLEAGEFAKYVREFTAELESINDGTHSEAAGIAAYRAAWGCDSAKPLVDIPTLTWDKHDGEATLYTRNRQGERYRYDFTECSPADGWRQYDTNQDAWYFGVWYHMERRVMVTFAEGDETIVVCHTDAAWRAELTEAAEFYGDSPPAFTAYGRDGTVTHYIDEEARPTLETA